MSYILSSVQGLWTFLRQALFIRLCARGGVYILFMRAFVGTRLRGRLLSELPTWALGISAPSSCSVFCLLLLELWEALRPIIQMVFRSVVFSAQARLFARRMGCRMLSDMQGL